jgi:hypothetical protein
MQKISLIFPSMGRYPPIFQFLEDLCQMPDVGEILFVNNDEERIRPQLTPTLLNNPKFKLLGNGTNIGCNGGWNLGASEAENEILGFCNDDLIWPIQALFRIQDYLSSEIPVIGMSAGDSVWKQHPLVDGKIDITKWETGEHTHGFGMLFFCLKEWWVPIPSSLFMYEGDAWVFDTTLIRNKPIYLLTNMMYKTPFAVTSSEIGSNELLMNEHRIYGEALDKWNKTR